ncbi:hypothetical protein EW146_g4264 [Bondarzewia mesenterica]|uniref:USP domain-containing protein n=1 Tax=Bondarzewia mesenterica TaxID=1095465 RepID=A0A4S4LW72_9AGAM|nr:hypothetical protein EW146_g4264 [Bondarzewia mesenterica]
MSMIVADDGMPTLYDDYDENNLPEFIPLPWTLAEIRQAIPLRLFVRNTQRSLMYLLRDLVMAALLWKLVLLFEVCLGSRHATSVFGPIGAQVVRWAIWVVYWWFQGLVFTGIWVIGHECGHGAFSSSRHVNNIIGFITHTFLWTPFFSWKISHHRHHSNHASMERDEVYVPKTRGDLGIPLDDRNKIDWEEHFGDTPIYTLFMLVRQQLFAFPVYLLTNVSGQKSYPRWTNHFDPNSVLFTKEQRNAVIISNFGIISMILGVQYACKTWGAAEVVKLYGIPWLLVTHWFIMITYLHHTDPEVPHYRNKAWNYQRGAAATVDRPFLGWQGRFFLHDVAHYHVIHHFFPKMPWYHGAEATKYLKEFIGDHYMWSDEPIFQALWHNYNECQFVEDEGEGRLTAGRPLSRRALKVKLTPPVKMRCPAFPHEYTTTTIKININLIMQDADHSGPSVAIVVPYFIVALLTNMLSCTRNAIDVELTMLSLCCSLASDARGDSSDRVACGLRIFGYCALICLAYVVKHSSGQLLRKTSAPAFALQCPHTVALSDQVLNLRLSMYNNQQNYGYSQPVASALGLDTGQDEEKVNTLVQMMGSLEPEIARRVLRKHNGDMDKAAASILDGDLEGDNLAPWAEGIPMLTSFSQATARPGPRTPPPSKPEQDQAVIDLTMVDEDKELNLALEASLEQGGTRFGPSEREPDPSLALVPTNQEVPTGISQDDQSLSRAIHESLHSTYNGYEEEYEQVPLEQRVRPDSRPVALRPSQSAYAYAALLFQGLYYVPQVRKNLAHWRPSLLQFDDEDASPPMDGPEHTVWSIVEVFTNMDLAVISELNIDEVLQEVDVAPPNHATESPGDLTCQLYSKVAEITETALHGNAASKSSKWPRLFHFRYGPGDSEPIECPFDRRVDTSVVKVDIHDGDQNNDLISCLSTQLSHTDVSTKQQVILEPSDVVAFQLVRHEAPPSYSGGPSAPKQLFRYPKQMYLDRFMRENAELANSGRTQQQELHEEIQRLTLRKAGLTHANSGSCSMQNRNTLRDLRASLHYFEHVANKDDLERREAIELTAMKLRKVLTRVENELETIDSQVTKLKSQAALLFEGQELRKHRYDLRVILVHDGLFGRNHIYSYVQQDGTWWKTLDWSVCEVPETSVLEDSSGLHLGAGPYLLIYSRALPENDESMVLPWPEGVKHSVKHNNKMFLDSLPPEAASYARYTSPPTSPHPSVSDWATPLSTVDSPSSPRGEPMDVSK